MQNVRTCPIDRREFNEILVRLDLDGVVVRKVPLHSTKNNDVEEADVLDVTHCQVQGICLKLSKSSDNHCVIIKCRFVVVRKERICFCSVTDVIMDIIWIALTPLYLTSLKTTGFVHNVMVLRLVQLSAEEEFLSL